MPSYFDVFRITRTRAFHQGSLGSHRPGALVASGCPEIGQTALWSRSVSTVLWLRSACTVRRHDTPLTERERESASRPDAGCELRLNRPLDPFRRGRRADRGFPAELVPAAPHREATPDRPGHRAHPGWLRAGHRCGGGDRDARDRGLLWLLGVPLATPLTMLMFLGAFIPIVGAALAVPPHGGGVVRGPVVAATARSDW